MTKTLNPKELAIALDSDARTVRKFLRSNESGIAGNAPGKGGRWAIEAKLVRSLKGKFAKWDAAQRAEREAARNAAATVEVTDDAPKSNDTPDDATNDAETLED